MSAVYRIQYASNLFVHQNATLCQSKRYLAPKHASNLALLGNIGFPTSVKTKEFIKWCCDNWLNVYWVPGPTELLQNHQVNSLTEDFSGLRNLTILDHKEDTLSYFPFKIIGAPLWVPWGASYSAELNEKQQYFLANKSWKTVADWHQEDIEFITNKVATDSKFLVLTHHLPGPFLLPKFRIDMQDLLYFGNGKLYQHSNILGFLSGAGYTTAQGFFGPHYTYSGVNAAFKSPDMVPNPSYRPDMIASFNFGESTRKPNGYGIAFDTYKKFNPVPSVAFQLQ